jgi:hypothetical protein
MNPVGGAEAVVPTTSHGLLIVPRNGLRNGLRRVRRTSMSSGVT